MTVTYYKDRSLDFSKPVRVYKNLNNGMMSIQQGGKVIAYSKSVTLKNVSFKVNEGGRQRVIRERQKNVHAYACGFIVDFEPLNEQPIKSPISYNPYGDGFFYHKSDGSEVIPEQEDLLFCGTQLVCLI